MSTTLEMVSVLLLHFIPILVLGGLGVYTMILLIKALKIYIKKNS